MKPCNIVLILQMEKLRHTDTFPIQDHTGNLWQDQHRLLIADVCLPQGSEGTTEHACSKDLWQRWSWGAPEWSARPFSWSQSSSLKTNIKAVRLSWLFFFLFCLFVFNYLDSTPTEFSFVQKKMLHTVSSMYLHHLEFEGLNEKKKSCRALQL